MTNTPQPQIDRLDEILHDLIVVSSGIVKVEGNQKERAKAQILALFKEVIDEVIGDDEGGMLAISKNNWKAEQTNQFDTLANELIEKKSQFRIEHNHADMKWYAYYAQKGQRKLFESDLYSNGDDDWQTASDTPTEALLKLKQESK